MTKKTEHQVTEQEVFEGSFAEEGVVRGVKLLGLRSKNRRNYNTKGVRDTAKSLLEGARVYIDHPSSPEQPRSYRDSFGIIESVEFRNGEGHFGTVRYNPDHQLAKQFAWDVQHNPKSLGMSINARIKPGKTDANGDVVVEGLELVRSVDIVTKPATADGIFESESPEEEPVMDLKTLKEKHPELVSQILESEGAKNASEQELEKLRADLKAAQDRFAAMEAEEAARKERLAVEAEWTPVLDAIPAMESVDGLRKEIMECACQAGVDGRKSLKSIFEKLSKLIPDPGDSDDDDDDDAAVDKQEQDDEPEPVPYRPGKKAKSGGYRSLSDVLGLKKD